MLTPTALTAASGQLRCRQPCCVTGSTWHLLLLDAGTCAAASTSRRCCSTTAPISICAAAAQWAAHAGARACLRRLLDRGAQVNVSDVGEHGTALRAAACAGHYECLRDLLMAGADVQQVVDVHYCVMTRGC